MLVSYRWDFETEETRYDMINPLKIHRVVVRGLLSVRVAHEYWGDKVNCMSCRELW